MPLISVILPVYNGALYLKEAIDSVLAQTERDFELLVVDDCSTDNSAAVVASYNDNRIVFVRNDRNLGLIGTLNKAIDLAKGAYIARMDQDDICLPERFSTQLRYFAADPAVKVVATPVMPITPEGKPRDAWPADAAAVTAEDIRRILPQENCIAHPSVMVKAETMRSYLYDRQQEGSEDWDLWLRMARDGVKIVKTREPLLRYRIHPGSITMLAHRKVPAALRRVQTRNRFLKRSLREGRVNGFILRVLFSNAKDRAWHLREKEVPAVARATKRVLTISPLAADRQFHHLRKTLEQNKSRFFLFFSYSHIGGAELVHAQITHVLAGEKPLVFFTGLKNRGGFEHRYPKEATLLRIEAACNHPLFARRTMKLIADAVNRTSEARVFGSNNYFLYDLIGHLAPHVVLGDLIHDTDYETDRVFYREYLTRLLRCNFRVFVSRNTLERTQAFYRQNFVEDKYFSRLHYVCNSVEIPEKAIAKVSGPSWRVLYVGRDSEEKRVQIIFRMAELAEARQLPFQFQLVGEIKPRSGMAPNLSLTGAVHDRSRLDAIYDASHFVLITSSREGFPMSIMEGMAHGCVPVSTAVGDVAYHVSESAAGAVVPNEEPEQVAGALLEVLTEYHSGKRSFRTESLNASDYARVRFSVAAFADAYRQLFGLHR